MPKALPTTHRIGVFLPLSLTYSRGVFKGIIEYVNHHPGWELVRTALPPERALRALRLDAAIVGIAAVGQAKFLATTGSPCVNVSSRLAVTQLPTVISDDRAVGRLAADYLLDRGWRQFGYVGTGAVRFSIERGAGFAERLAKEKAACAVFDDPGATAGLRSWLRALPTPTAIFTANDRQALNLIRICRDLGLHVPRDLAIVGVDHDEVEAAMAGISLTSVELDTTRIGYTAATMLARLLAGRRIQQPELRIPPLRVVGGESSAANPVSDPRLRDVLTYINAHHAGPIYTADLCRIARLPRRMLERRFQQFLGRSPNSHVLQVRVAHAKELLVTTNWPISRISEACGFDHKKFALAFRQKTSLTPTQYRAANRPV